VRANSLKPGEKLKPKELSHKASKIIKEKAKYT